MANIRDESTVFKLNLALKRLPVFKGFDAQAQGFAYPAAVRIGPSTDYIEKAFDASKYGDFSRRPVMTMVTASALDDTLAPPGKHVMSVMGQHAPYTLRGRTWADARDELYRTTLETIEEFAPGFADCIEHVQLLTPLDFETIFDLPRGHVHHGELSADQIFFRRPVRKYGDHRTPIRGPLPVRRLHPPGRRRHRRAGPQRGPGDPGRPRKPLNGCVETTRDDPPMVELQQVSKRYGDVVALAAVDLAVRKGEFVTLLGPSGSGKTTLLNLIAGMAQPTRGRILIDGRDATRAAAERARPRHGVPELRADAAHDGLRERRLPAARAQAVERGDRAARSPRCSSSIRLPDIAQRKPRELSGGQQQRVALARCIVYNPSLILMDEPLGALDKKLREQMQLEIKRIHAELGITMLYVTHDQEEALTMSDRIVLMNGGRIEQQCAPEELYFRPCSVFAAGFIGDANLFEAAVTAVNGTAVELSSASGPITSGRPSFPVKPGDAVTLLVRPENMRLLPDGDVGGTNVVEGTVRDSIVLGGAVKHHITLRSGAEVVMQESNHVGRTALRRAQPVRLGWSAQDSVVLPPEGASS